MTQHLKKMSIAYCEERTKKIRHSQGVKSVENIVNGNRV